MKKLLRHKETGKFFATGKWVNLPEEADEVTDELAASLNTNNDLETYYFFPDFADRKFDFTHAVGSKPAVVEDQAIFY